MSNQTAGKLTAVLGGLVVLASAGSAHGQEWLKDRQTQSGPGYRAGDIELHPGLAGEIGYDSNYLLRSFRTSPLYLNGAPNAPEEGAGVLRITPSLGISTVESKQRTDTDKGAEQTLLPPPVTLNAGLSATYREFIGPEVVRSQRNVSGDANFQLGILPQRSWGANVFANYSRTIQPTVYGNPDLSFNRDDLGAGAEIVAQPNGGTFDWRLGYQVHATLFEQGDASTYNNIMHTVFTRGGWKFRPRTSLVYDGSIAFRSYTQPDQGSFGALHDSTPVKARLGINGLITPRFSLLAMAGYAASFFDTNKGRDAGVQQYDSVIGQLELKFFPTVGASVEDPTQTSLVISSIALGYNRDYQQSYFGDFNGTDRGYLNLSYFFAGRVLVSLEGGVGAVEYPTIYFAGGDPTNPVKAHDSFTDVRADATLFAEYRFLASLGINATVRYTENFSDTQIAMPTTGANGAVVPGSQLYDMAWRRFEAYLGLRWFM